MYHVYYREREIFLGLRTDWFCENHHPSFWVCENHHPAPNEYDCDEYRMLCKHRPHVAHPYIMGGAGQTCAAAGGVNVNTVSECQTAWNAINAEGKFTKKKGPQPIRTSANYGNRLTASRTPSKCSVLYTGQFVNTHHQQRPHFNSEPVGPVHPLLGTKSCENENPFTQFNCDTYRMLCKRR